MVKCENTSRSIDAVSDDINNMNISDNNAAFGAESSTLPVNMR